MHLAVQLFLRITAILLPVLIDVAFLRSRSNQYNIIRLPRNTSNNKKLSVSNTTISNNTNNTNASMSSLDSFSEIFNKMWNRGGGRRPQLPNEYALDKDEETWMKPTEEGQSRLTIVQITDVYT
jgi:hypothetical protein